MLNILICSGPEDREGRWTAIHCLPSRKRRGLAQLENAGRRVSPVLVGSRVEVFGRRNLASVRGDAVAFIRTGRVTPLNLVGPALGARYPVRAGACKHARKYFAELFEAFSSAVAHVQQRSERFFGNVRKVFGEIRNVVR